MSGATLNAQPSEAEPQACGPWNPGIRSPLPRELRPLATLFRPENVFTDARYAEEIVDLTGLPLADVVTFRPARLALHELLVRITADVSVPDGQRIEDLGINFREITRAILGRYVEPRMPVIEAAYGEVCTRARAAISQALDALYAPAPPAPRAWWRRARAEPAALQTDADAPLRAIDAWQRAAVSSDDFVVRAALAALAKVVASLVARHGRLWGDRELIASVATGMACNQAGAEAIGRIVDAIVVEAAREQGHRLLPAQQRPVVMNTKGPSASGKSTIRPLQRTLARYIGVAWTEFALISPDIWRKQLLDYESLGEHYKYAGPFTGDELAIVDRKLDDYMARKAASGIVPHLLIDRFRFDSFAPDSDEAGSNLLTRFGHVVYLFFLITPPASIVERAWQRGLEVGRYKSVDDLLAHAVEAYSGMPQLFFTWVSRGDKRVHFEFLDNSVAYGELPRTVAFGWNDALNVLDVKSMLDIERYRRVDIDAKSPQALYTKPAELAPERNAFFLRECVQRFAEVNFADRTSGRVYARVENGVPAWADPGPLADALRDDDTRAALRTVAPGVLDAIAAPQRPTFVEAAETVHTVGDWRTT